MSSSIDTDTCHWPPIPHAETIAQEQNTFLVMPAMHMSSSNDNGRFHWPHFPHAGMAVLKLIMH